MNQTLTGLLWKTPKVKTWLVVLDNHTFVVILFCSQFCVTDHFKDAVTHCCRRTSFLVSFTTLHTLCYKKDNKQNKKINKIWFPRLIYHLLECVHVNISHEQTHQWTYSVHNCTVNAKHEYCIANICCQRKAYWSYCLMILIHGFLNYYRLKLPLIFTSQPEKNCLCDIWR